MSDNLPSSIPLPVAQTAVRLPVDQAFTQYLPDLIKKKSINLDMNDSSGNDKSDRKKHKKSKSHKKSKDRDKDRDKRDKVSDQGLGLSSGVELTAAEKFNIFKKQREAAKGDDKIVDDMFNDFIASKIKQYDEMKEKKHKSDKEKRHKSDRKEKKHKSDSKEKKHKSDTKDKKHKSISKRNVDEVAISVEEMNKFLDCEINNIANPPEETFSAKQTTDIPQASQVISHNTTTAFKAPIPVTSDGFKSLSDFNQDKTKVNTKITNEAKVETKEIACTVPMNIPLPPDPTDIAKPPVIIGPMLPRSLAVNEKKDSKEEKGEVKKTFSAFKNFGIKLSVTSKELIQSGEVHKKGKRLEEGEVISSSASDGSDSSDTEVEDEDDNNGDDDNEISGTGSISDSDDSKSKKKKSKKKKGKHKKKKKHKDGDDVLVVGKEKSTTKRKVSITPRSRSRSPKKSKRSRSPSKDKSRRRSRSRSRSRRSSPSRHRSQRSRSRTRRSRSRSRSRRSRSRDRHRRSRSKGRSRKRSPTPDRFWRSKYGDFDAYKFLKKERGEKGRSRSRSPDRERDKFIEKEKKRMADLRGKIDKAKLREIAIKNALSNAKSGGPSLDVTLKAGGKSVEELTDFCKRIQDLEKEKRKYKNQYSSSSEEERNSDDENIHHPFKVREPGAIVMDIRNARQLPVVTPQERLAQVGTLRLQFPVSSGSQHREKEWVPVNAPEPPKPKPPTLTLPGGALALPAPPELPPEPKPEIKVFEEPPTVISRGFQEKFCTEVVKQIVCRSLNKARKPIDIKTLVSERLTAVRKLQENPYDVGAKAVLSKAQHKASQWAQSKHLPGQFIGSTGASIMSHDELIGPNKKRQAWLKKDVFTNAAPVSGGIGMFLLQKMGWKYGEGLGKNNEGSKEPLMLDFKIDRKGLVTDGEGKKGSAGGGGAKMPVVRDLSGKHPVSALGELCNKRRWNQPKYEIVHESGPAHKKDFLYKVLVNGTEYQPSVASNNKKLAKSQSATVCLQTLGLVPRTIQ